MVTEIMDTTLSLVQTHVDMSDLKSRDFVASCRIGHRVVAEWENGLGKESHVLYRVCSAEQALLGVAGITNMWRFPEAQVMIEPKFRGRGVGFYALHGLMANYLELAGGKRLALPVSVCVAEDDAAQEGLLRKCGFRRMEIPVAYERMMELGERVAKWRWEWRAS